MCFFARNPQLHMYVHASVCIFKYICKLERASVQTKNMSLPAFRGIALIHLYSHMCVSTIANVRSLLGTIRFGWHVTHANYISTVWIYNSGMWQVYVRSTYICMGQVVVVLICWHASVSNILQKLTTKTTWSVFVFGFFNID